MTTTQERAREAIAERLCRWEDQFDWDKTDRGPYYQEAIRILAALAAAGIKCLEREPSSEMCQMALEKACTAENKGIEFAPYVAWQAMWDVA